jgi:predicted DNA-binding protein
MGKKRGDQVKEPVQVYLDRQDAAILSNLAEQTGQSKAAVLRRAIRQLAQQELTGTKKPGWSIDAMIEILGDDPSYPPDMAERHDYYLAKDLEERKGRGAGPH